MMQETPQDGYSSDPEPLASLPRTHYVPHTPKTPARASSAPPMPFGAPSSPLSILESPVKVGPGRPTLHKRRRAAEKGMSAEEKHAQHVAQNIQRKRPRVMQSSSEGPDLEKSMQMGWRTTQGAVDEVETRARETAHVNEGLRALKDVGWGTLWEFVDAFFGSADQHVSSQASKLAKRHGTALMTHLKGRDPEGTMDFAQRLVASQLQREAEGLRKLLTRPELGSISTVLEGFSMSELGRNMEQHAPTLWELLGEVAVNRERRVRLDAGDKVRRDHAMVLATICGMLSITRSQNASNFQLVIGLFLLASGAQKRMIEVLAHAGFSLSYSAIISKIKVLSREGTARFVRIAHEQMCMIVWDNVNIAFRVAQQRVQSKDHFDNGTTATLVPLFNPHTLGEVPLGFLAHELKPPRVTRRWMSEVPIDLLLPTGTQEAQLRANCLWQIKRLAVSHIPGLDHLKDKIGVAPAVKLIPLHKTEQYPLPAMHIDESSIEGTILVLETITGKTLRFSGDDLKKHGLFFVDGDLLTIMLVDKVESARRDDTDFQEGMQWTIRRFGLFHAKIAGNRMVVNEHWGTPNTQWAGCLWKENAVAGRKPMMAGWKAKKLPPWKQSHELVQISIRAHIWDAYRVHCGQESLEEWGEDVSEDEFNQVSETVLSNLFSSPLVEELRSKDAPARDHILENTILYNRDALLYVEFYEAIKCGDIGRVVNILRVWMIMMRGGNCMPKYADVGPHILQIGLLMLTSREIFLCNWLVNLTGKPNRFKEVDLLQEHQNFWAKVIYTAKGVNKSWEWLSMITVCIFVMRDILRSVHHSFKIPSYGTQHTNPKMDQEIRLLVEYLKRDQVQSYVQHRPGQTDTKPVRDLLAEGAKYPHTPKAFRNFLRETRIAKNTGTPTAAAPDHETSEEAPTEPDLGHDSALDDYEVSGEDLGDDEEEFSELADSMLAAAMEMMEANGY